MTRGARLGVIVGSMLLLSSFGASASAQRQGDGLYNRWDRGLTLSFGAGPGATWLNGKADPNLVGEARFLVADVAGVVLSGRWGPDSGQHLFLGVDLRPLFPALFFLYKQTWNEFADLLLQSIFLEIGPAFLLDGNRSTALGVGFGMAGMFQQQQAQGQGAPQSPPGQPQGQQPAGGPGALQGTAPEAGGEGGITCPACNAAVSSGKFCAECGKPLAPEKRFCPSCGVEVGAKAKFCAGCGTKMPG